MPRVSIGNYDFHYAHNDVEPSNNEVAMVLVHGAGGQEMDWPVTWRSPGHKARLLGLAPKSHARQLDRFPVYAVDLPGHGKSGGESMVTVDAYADAISAFLETLELRRVLLVGHSMGAAIALTLAVRQDPRLAGIALIGGSSRLVVSDAILEGLKTDFEATVDSIVRYSWFKTTGALFKRKGRQHMLEAGQTTVYNDFLACSRFNLSADLEKVRVPALIIASDSDRMVPVDKSRQMANGLTDSEYLALSDCGHFLHVEEDNRVADALVSFLTRRLRAD